MRITGSMFKNKKTMDILHIKQTSLARYSKIFLRQQEMQNRPVSNIRINDGGDLVKSSDCFQYYSKLIPMWTTNDKHILFIVK